ncbi:hypothetical protein ENKNEFLB_02371 [Nocardioides aquaticus]|uniref:DUF1501 domain-containing protein n=1 Tax=Nocardioides aquaticus TaxID=160826 RepID=A0ABX8EK32_9ACTN|nr:DUF1501 domain-containing protein [Nocardioides aquaticus]QVT79981.1 hypothetical protein ENKNEFLB_02371 [Nocardioides aquaticus]
MTTTASFPSTPGECGCPEYAGLSRRGVLGLGAGLIGATTATTMVGDAVLQTARAASGTARSTLVVLSLRGAADGLSMVVPHGDPAYYRARPKIGIPANTLWGSDGFFGWHPALRPLQGLWNQGRLAAVQAVGLPAPNRSHFSAMEEVEDAAPGSTTRAGWLNRLVGLEDRTTPLRAINLDAGALPSSLVGPTPAMSTSSVDSVVVAGGVNPREREASLRTLWGGRDDGLGRAAQMALGAVADFAPARRTSAKPLNGARYPSGDLGGAMATAARIIRGDVGTEVLTVDHGSWDMHSGMGNIESGLMQRSCTELAQSIAAFFTDLGPRADTVTLVTLTEFGRRIVENPNRGLDHGFGSMMMLAGAGVRGGRFYGRFPDLGVQGDSDLTVTTDYRSVLAEVVSTRFGASTASVFPGFSGPSLGAMSSMPG